MRLPRNFKMLRGPVDSSTLAGTLFLLWTATLLHSSLVMPPGIRMNLPVASEVWGEVVPQMALAVDATGRLLFEHQLTTESNLVAELRARVAKSGPGQTLLVLADGSVTAEKLAHLFTVARSAGVREVVLGTSPRPGVPDGRGSGKVPASVPPAEK